jgi:hypothetical protein
MKLYITLANAHTYIAWFNQLAGLSDPGAGLRDVEMPIAEIESLFDSIFLPQKDKMIPEPNPAPSNVLQIYGSDQDM